MDFILNYWYIIVAGLALAAVAVIYAADFSRKSKDEQLEKVREWLLYAVMEAEKMFGSKTGVLKLRYVYDLFVGKFPWVAKALPFETFSDLVDKALVEMKLKLQTNDALAEYVEGEVAPGEKTNVGELAVKYINDVTKATGKSPLHS